MVTGSNLIAGLATRFPDEFSQGLDIGSEVIDNLEVSDDGIGSIGEALSMTAHEVAVQKVALGCFDNVQESIILLGADCVVTAFFEIREGSL